MLQTPTREYVPTPEEIATATAAIRGDWTPAEFAIRRTVITDLPRVDRARCPECGYRVTAPCRYCESKSQRDHTPAEFVASPAADAVGLSDAAATFYEAIRESVVDEMAECSPVGGGDYVAE